jgi:hypothetical protein
MSLPVAQNPRVIETNIYATVAIDGARRLSTTVAATRRRPCASIRGKHTAPFEDDRFILNRLREPGAHRFAIPQIVYDGPSGAMMFRVQYYFDWDRAAICL